jgi:hypothetical protein
MEDEMTQGEKLILVLVGAASGLASIAILFDYYMAPEWISPVLGILALILLAVGLGADGDREPVTRV